jgi:hypothetical protein
MSKQYALEPTASTMNFGKIPNQKLKQMGKFRRNLKQ